MSTADNSPASVAPIRATISRCEQLGVCQACAPRCGLCADEDERQEQDGLDRISYYLAIGIASAVTVSWVAGVTSYLLHRFGWLTL